MKRWTLEAAREDYQKKNIKKCCKVCTFCNFRWKVLGYMCDVKRQAISKYDVDDPRICEYFTLKEV